MSLEIRTQPTDRGTSVVVSGVVDESADFSTISGLTGSVEVDLSGVRRINSFGARCWMEAMRRLTDQARLVFVGCSPPVIDQLNMIQGFLGHGRVTSFYAPMLCERCDIETLHLFDADECRQRDGALPPVPCKSCGRPMELDDLEEQYTFFLREPTMVG